MKNRYLIVLIISLLGGYLLGIYTIEPSNKEVTINIEGTYQKDRVETISIDDNTLYYYFKNNDNIILMNRLNKDVNYFTKVFNYASFDES